MRYKNRLFAIGLIAAMSIGSLCGCGRGGDDNTKLIFTTGFAKDEVFRIEDQTCKLDELMVYLTTTQNQYESVYGAQIWDTALDGVTLEENVKETVLAKIAQIKTMHLLALEKGVTLDEKELAKVTEAANDYYNSLNDKEKELMDVSLETIEKLYQEYALADKVYQQIIQDINPEISDDEARTITVQHILIRTYTTDGAGKRVDYTDSMKQSAMQQMQEIRELAVSGEHDFADLASRYSEDSVITYSFGKGEMDIAFENAAFQLETGEISQIVESESGYHIIKCLNTFDREETDANKLQIVEERRKEVFGQEYDKFVSNLVRNLNTELWEEVTFIHDEEVTTSNFFEIYAKHFED